MWLRRAVTDGTQLHLTGWQSTRPEADGATAVIPRLRFGGVRHLPGRVEVRRAAGLARVGSFLRIAGPAPRR